MINRLYPALHRSIARTVAAKSAPLGGVAARWERNSSVRSAPVESVAAGAATTV